MPHAPRSPAAAAALVLALAPAAPALAAQPAPITLSETGSTLFLPVFKAWADGYPAAHPGVTVTTDGSGSARGIAAAIDGSVRIGASDAYLQDDEAERHPGILNVAMAISAQLVAYNVPGLAQPLRLDGPTLAGIYAGRIRAWDDPAIGAINPGASLPHHDIVPVRRADGSGDTFVFTQYLSFATSSPAAVGFFTSAASWATSPGYGTTIDWPRVDAEQSATGNQGVLDLLQHTPYSLGYLGITFEDQAAQARLGTAMLRSYSGEFLAPSGETIAAAAESLTPRTPADERLSLVNAPGANCYPLINYEYALVSTTQPNAATAAALRSFLLWAVAPDEDNARVLQAAHLLPLPAHVWVSSHDQIERIGRPDRRTAATP